MTSLALIGSVSELIVQAVDETDFVDLRVASRALVASRAVRTRIASRNTTGTTGLTGLILLCRAGLARSFVGVTRVHKTAWTGDTVGCERT